MEKLCGFVPPAGEKAYFFTGDRYIRYDVAADRIDDGYPLQIAGHWPGLFESDIDAALPWSDGSVFFFRGDQCLSYDLGKDEVLAGPDPIAEIWPGLFESGIDAAVLWGSGNAYFFSGQLYQKFDGATGEIDPEPRPIAEDWPGAFSSRIETVLWWPSGNPYFFSGDRYARHDPETGALVEGYPRDLAEDWPGLPIGPVAGGGTTSPVVVPAGSPLSVREFFPGFTVDFEGRVPYLYQDIKGLVTVGVGNLVDTPGEAAALPFVHKDTRVPATQAQITAEWHMIKNAPGLAEAGHLAAKAIHTLELPEDAIDALVLRRFDTNEGRLARFYPGWAQWPADARVGAHSIAWAGAFFPTRWPKFNAAANAGDWVTAAAESHLQEHRPGGGTARRNRANRQLFLNAAAVVARGLDPSIIYYPTAL